MKLSELNEWLALIANIGVLVGVLLLVFELQQSRFAVETQTRAEISDRGVEEFWNWASNPDVLEARIKSNQGEELTQLERGMLGQAMRATFRRRELVYYLYLQGLYSDDEFEGQLQAWRGSLRQNSYSDFWERNRTQFSTQFIELIDGFLSEL